MKTEVECEREYYEAELERIKRERGALLELLELAAEDHPHTLACDGGESQGACLKCDLLNAAQVASEGVEPALEMNHEGACVRLKRERDEARHRFARFLIAPPSEWRVEKWTGDGYSYPSVAECNRIAGIDAASKEEE